MSGTKQSPRCVPTDEDPVVVAGDVLPELRVQFWDFMSLPLLQGFLHIASRGDLGKIDSITGVGRTDDGRAYSFRWKRGGHALVRKSAPIQNAGHARIAGRLDFETINRIRNFPLFHLRPEFRYVG